MTETAQNMPDAKYFTKLYLKPLEDIVSYLEEPTWLDDGKETEIAVDETETFTLDLEIDKLKQIEDTKGDETPEEDYEYEITDDDTIEITNTSDSAFTVDSIKYIYSTHFNAVKFGDVNWSRAEPPLLMIQPDIFSVEGGDTSINRVLFNFIYPRSYSFSDFEKHAGDIFTMMGLIIAEFNNMEYNIGDVNISEIEAYQGEIDGTYLESLSIEVIFTSFIDWDEYFDR